MTSLLPNVRFGYFDHFMTINAKQKPLVLRALNISKIFDEQVILGKVNFAIHAGEKVGLVGPNGIGKSTLLKIIEGKVEPTGGTLDPVKSALVCLPQLGEDSSVKVVLSGVPPTGRHRFGITDDILDRPLASLSGGERTRVYLARLAFVTADLYLLDEPTNNLDMDGLALLEQFISKSKAAFLIVSHDRRFLDNSVTRIIEIDEWTRETRLYDGAWSAYAQARAARLEREWQDYEEALKEHEKLVGAASERTRDVLLLDNQLNKKVSRKEKFQMRSVRGYVLAKSGKAARHARLLKERAERTINEGPKRPRTIPAQKLPLQFDKQSGDKVFALQGAIVCVGRFSLGPIDLDISFGDRLLLVGDNGAGKTTLLRLLMNEIHLESGAIERGSRLQIGYLPQVAPIDEHKTVLEYAMQHSGMDMTETRSLLSRFAIDVREVDKTLSRLSPGLRSRLLLAVLAARLPNCIILDEPSNHLDPLGLEVLEAALHDYKGTLIVVSHDRMFIDNVGFTREIRMDNF